MKNPSISSQWILFISVFLYPFVSSDHKVLQPNCWNEFDDVASRAYVAPVVVRAFCTVIYSRASVPQFNASFHVTSVVKSNPAVGKFLTDSPRIDLHFGVMEDWVKQEEFHSRKEPKNRGEKSCWIEKPELQKEYILFLRYRTVSEQEEMENEIVEPGKQPGKTWTVFAAPVLATDQQSSLVMRALRKAKRPFIQPMKSLSVSEGDSVALRCLVRGFPHPKVSWTKDGRNLERRSKRIALRSRSYHLHRLRIKKSEIGDAGEYRCVAENVLGRVESAVKVKVLPVHLDYSQSGSSPSIMTDSWNIRGVPCPERGFCQNGGICTLYPKVNARSCNCTSGFEGLRCENSAYPTTEHAIYRLNHAPFEIFVYFTLVFLIICILSMFYFIWRIHRRLHKLTSLPSPAGSPRHQRIVHEKYFEQTTDYGPPEQNDKPQPSANHGNQSTLNCFGRICPLCRSDSTFTEAAESPTSVVPTSNRKNGFSLNEMNRTESPGSPVRGLRGSNKLNGRQTGAAGDDQPELERPFLGE